MNKIRVAIIEDETMVAQMLATWLEHTGEFTVLGRAATGAEGWELCTRCSPEVVLLDVELSGTDGLELAGRLKRSLPHTKIIVVSGREDPYMLYRMHQLDLSGYVSKGISIGTLREAILAVAQGQRFYSEPFARLLAAEDAFFRVLTTREVEVLYAATQGLAWGAIARKLQIASGTVQKHFFNMRRKLGLHNRTELLLYATRIGMDL